MGGAYKTRLRVWELQNKSPIDGKNIFVFLCSSQSSRWMLGVKKSVLCLLLRDSHGLYCEYDNLPGNVPTAQQFSISYEPIYFLDLGF